MSWGKTAMDMLQRAFAKGRISFFLNGDIHDSRRPKKPGEIIQGMTDEERELLKGLKSDDIAEGKLDRYAPYLQYQTRDERHRASFLEEAKKLMSKFDRKILKRK